MKKNNPKEFDPVSFTQAKTDTELTNSAKWLFVLLLSGVSRKRRNGEPVKKVFELSYLHYSPEIPRASFGLSVKELIAKQFIRVSGKQRSKQYELLKW